jgi:hypothetical protein
MRKLLLLLVTLITFTNVSYASFPVVEKISDQTIGSNGPLLEMGGITLIIWTIVAFTLLTFLIVYLRTNRVTNPFELFQISGWRRGPWLWPLYLLALGLLVVAGNLMMNLMWRGLGFLLFGGDGWFR